MKKRSTASPQRSSTTRATYSAAIHGLAIALTTAVFPLIWVGGLVTTYDAGMAVPDWPGTYGWNMFAYPVATWLFGPFDLLIEHSHRLLGSLAGMISIALVIVACRRDCRLWFRWWCAGVLLFVILQGGLGGARVVLDQRALAMLHGCTGPLFFAFATATAVMSSRWWIERGDHRGAEPEISFPEKPNTKLRATRWVVRLSTALVLTSYCQLIVGAQLRHINAAQSHRVFMSFVHTHLLLAAFVLILAGLLAAIAGRGKGNPRQIKHPIRLLAMLVLAQVALGIATWIVNYALPWSELTETLARYTILAKGYWESMIVTAHMATGSLILSIATVVCLRSWRSRGIENLNEVNWKWTQQVA